MLSLVVPIYRNEENLPRLIQELVTLRRAFPVELEIVFVVDGSPDDSYRILRERLPETPLRSQLISLSRNFGSFSAIGAGLAYGRGDYFAVIAADLQEPPEIVIQFLELMQSGEADIAFGVRASRSDPWFAELTSTTFWSVYRRFVVRDMPPGGVDIFGCTKAVRDQLLTLREINTNLIALLFWLGYKRKFVPYHRRPRLQGHSAWTFGKKLQYCIDSIFNFTDLPLRVLLITGVSGSLFALVTAAVVLVCRLLGLIEVPGYTPIVLAITFFGGLTTLGLGIIGQYIWLALQNIRGRPNYIVSFVDTFGLKETSERTSGRSSQGGAT